MTNEENEIAIDYIRAALTTTRLVAGREVVIRHDGITVTDPLGGKHHFGNLETPPSFDVINETLQRSFYSYTGSRDREMKASGHGAWAVTEKNGNIVLKATKKRNAALEALATADAESLSLMRSLYGLPNVDIFVACEGDTRTKDVAFALASELNLSGRNTSLNVPPEYAHRWNSGRNEDALDQEGPALFDVPKKVGQEWVVELLNDSRDRFKLSPPAADVSRIVVFEDERAANSWTRATEGSFAPSRRPAIMVAITLVDSAPTATIILSSAAKAVARTDLREDNAPWTVYNERKAARLKSRPPVLKTWHQTTDQVARAFVARQAPRGFVSGSSLWFHGPVAFSEYRKNPIAAFVDTPSGKTILFSGRASGQLGTLAGTVSGALGDIDNATKATPFRFHVGELTDFLTLGDLPLDEVCWRVGDQKKEAEYPSSCTVDAAKLEQYIVKRRSHADAALEKASKQSVATYTKAACWKELASIAEFRDAMVELLGISLPDMGDAEEFKANGKAIDGAARVRQADLEKARVTAKQRENEAIARANQGVQAPNPFRHIR
ncbi:hypothetical protein [Rhizobium sp. BK176]|uniref:hypothetical protein n=1 Tax=Rhizobium sp. BK176 TaxID=2587071 RepID=UPI00216A8696|nr:hypothetical protein [Rhizobium sp. BK176]MCS4088898.1 hypothetical protein [Rhizobium sp. BK176]